jgi:nickel transport protein
MKTRASTPIGRPGPLLCALAAALPAAASAHDLWLERDGGAYVLRQGHKHSDHAGQELVPYAAGAAREAHCLDASGKPRPVKPGAGTPARIDAECGTLTVLFSTGYWTKTAWETRNVPKTGIPGVVKSWLSEETVKRIERWSAAAALPASNWLELAPAQDPRTLATGDKLKLRVYLDGKPLAGAAVAYDGDVRGVTGEDGSIAVRLRRPGLQLISASAEAPLADGKADSIVRSATLNFDLPAP